MTNAELAVLSLVAERPRHGYDIERLIVQRGMREWTDVGFSSIYYLLGKMEKAGLVEAHAAEPGERGPARKVYAPTPAGFEAWRAATVEALAIPASRSPFALGLANLGGLDDEEALAALRERRGQLAERASGVAAKREAGGALDWFVTELFDFSDEMLAAETKWVEGLIGRIEARGKERTMNATFVEPKLKVGVPVILERPASTMAVVHTLGDPQGSAARAFPALYGAAYGLKFALKKAGGPEYKVPAPRARWFGGPEWASLPRDEWRAAWGIELPEGTTLDQLNQKDPETPVVIERWQYGLVAEVLYVGTYAEETATIEALHAFIAEQGYEIAGPHEEEYRSRPEAKNPKTVIRYEIRMREA